MKLTNRMKKPRQLCSGAASNILRVGPLALTLALTVWIVSQKIPAQTIPRPVITIAPTNGTQVAITITNAVATTNYEIYRTPVLGDTNFPWTLHLVGSVGQSNFVAGIGVYESGFFKAGIGDDWDLDGVPNWGDANPLDPTIGWLTITIDSPTNGASLQ